MISYCRTELCIWSVINRNLLFAPVATPPIQLYKDAWTSARVLFWSRQTWCLRITLRSQKKLWWWQENRWSGPRAVFSSRLRTSVRVSSCPGTCTNDGRWILRSFPKIPYASSSFCSIDLSLWCKFRSFVRDNRQTLKEILICWYSCRGDTCRWKPFASSALFCARLDIFLFGSKNFLRTILTFLLGEDSVSKQYLGHTVDVDKWKTKNIIRT